MNRVVRVTLSGSFHKDPVGLETAYLELIQNQCQILSPHRIDFEDEGSLFVRHSSEEDDSIMSIETHHLRSIGQSDFLWLHAPDGYIGLSTALEIGYAHAQHIPIFSATPIDDQTLAVFVLPMPSVFMALRHIDTA